MSARALVLTSFAFFLACGEVDDAASEEVPTSSPPSSSSGSVAVSEGCDLTEGTTATDRTSDTGCAVLDRDPSGCRAAREALGLSGAWLSFSCRVTLGVSNGNVTATFDGQPDYASSYFTTDDVCHAEYAGARQNPNLIAVLNTTLSFPQSPGGTGGAMRGAIVGVALNGVPIFGNFAAPRDDIYTEALTFDRCAGHPQQQGVYHYHSEPYSLTNDDALLVGFLLDGYPVYGRRDADGSLPSLDDDGGHIGTTRESPSTPVYHYHVNEQTSTNARTAGERQWFLTKGRWHGGAGTCTGTGC